MIAKWLLRITMAGFLAVVCFGIYERRTYTDITGDPSYLDNMQASERSEDGTLQDCAEMKELLPLAPVVIKVTVLGEAEHFARTSRQLVRVEDIYKGEGIQKGEDVYITSASWRIAFVGGEPSLERGFINLLEVGDEYLVFIGREADGLGERRPVYEVYEGTGITPVFALREHENAVYEVGVPKCVPYHDVRNNEFFAETQTAVDAFLELKAEMFALYGVS